MLELVFGSAMDMNFAISIDGTSTVLRPPDPEYKDMLGLVERSGMDGVPGFVDLSIWPDDGLDGSGVVVSSPTSWLILSWKWQEILLENHRKYGL
jgi:hypothetical protein